MSIIIYDKQFPKMQSIRKILIANRGEIARRIIRTAKKMGILSLAVYTSEEQNALYVQEADQAVSLGSGSLSETFLNITSIVHTALQYQCDAVHPGYGFLSENPEFAQACSDAGLIFIGPDANSIRLMGNKSSAREYVAGLGIPLPPSVQAQSYAEAKIVSAELNYPLIIKAVAGGGGKGMKIVYAAHELKDAWESAQREALAYFGNATLYLEQYMTQARHIEVQVLGDNYGNVVHLFERECTIQRRHQKIIEEAPSPSLNPVLRSKLLEMAVQIASSMRYSGAGTLEFLADQDMNFYFLEMNTRIQVEHPVTEAITGLDIVEEQIRIAQGFPLRFGQNDIHCNGHAIEVRVYAEDPFTGFMPSAGKMLLNHLPAWPGIRIDSAYSGAAEVPSSFDPMIAKVTTHASGRNGCIANMQLFLKQCVVHGIKTNLEYLSLVMSDPDFQQNHLSTLYCIHSFSHLKQQYDCQKAAVEPGVVIGALLCRAFSSGKSHDIWKDLGAWRFPGTRTYSIDNRAVEVQYQLPGKNRILFSADGKNYILSTAENQEHEFVFHLNSQNQRAMISEVNNGNYLVSVDGFTFYVQRTDLPDTGIFAHSRNNDTSLNGHHVFSPLNGKVIKLNVKKGDKVKKGELLLIIESMKMENNILSPREAVVSDVMVSNGDQVTGKELLIKLSMAN